MIAKGLAMIEMICKSWIGGLVPLRLTTVAFVSWYIAIGTDCI